MNWPSLLLYNERTRIQPLNRTAHHMYDPHVTQMDCRPLFAQMTYELVPNGFDGDSDIDVLIK